MNTIILGAGITGLAAGHKTGGTIYEATDKSGGICRSYYKNGFRFEVGGGHWIFGADTEVVSFLNKFCSFKTYSRNAGVYINKTFPYPIQSFFNPCVIPEENTMKEWLLGDFGSDQCDLFFYPFHEKYTAGLYEHIAPQDPQKSPRSGTGYNSEFLYPIGGLDIMIDKISDNLDIKYNKRVVEINPNRHMVYFDDGDCVKYDRLISTLPLNTMATLLGKTSNMPYTSTLVLNIGATKGRNCPNEHWLYIPFCKSGFHRVGFYSNVDESFAPSGKVGIYVEWAYKVVRDAYINTAIAELRDWGFIDKVDEHSINEIDISYTWRYPNSTEREDLLSVITNMGITQIGRYGRWKFQGIAESIKEGLSC
jgi:protoporphyrinogen oxidase